MLECLSVVLFFYQGPITRDELREILQQPGEEALTDEDIDEIFQLIDLNDDNEISVDGN